MVVFLLDAYEKGTLPLKKNQNTYFLGKQGSSHSPKSFAAGVTA